MGVNPEKVAQYKLNLYLNDAVSNEVSIKLLGKVAQALDALLLLGAKKSVTFRSLERKEASGSPRYKRTVVIVFAFRHTQNQHISFAVPRGKARQALAHWLDV
eukprot:scaffold524354_cov21-Prasinocladus_malaysianus.AAC.1